MKNTLLFLCITQLLIPFESVKAETFEVPLLVVRRGQVNQPVRDINIRAQRIGASVIQGQIPGRTDQDGKAVIRFDSPMQRVEIAFKVLDHPSGEKWYVRFYGFYSNGNPDLPPHVANASPIPNGVLRIEAYPENELAAVAMQDLAESRTGMVGTAVADAVLIRQPDRIPKPAPHRPSFFRATPDNPLIEPPNSHGTITLTDPTRSYEAVAKTLRTSPEKAKDLIQKWQGRVDSAPGAAKPDEKSLSALLKGDVGKATEFAKVAAGLNGSEKSQLVAISDTGRLAETLYQLNIAAQDRASSLAKTQLEQLERQIKPLRPTREGRFPASAFDASKLDKFSETVREKASNIRE